MTTSDSANKAMTHIDTGNGSRITAMATEQNTQTPMQGLADAVWEGFPSQIGQPV